MRTLLAGLCFGTFLLGLGCTEYSTTEPPLVAGAGVENPDDGATVDSAQMSAQTVDGFAFVTEFGDCNNNGVPDEYDITDGTSADCNENGIPDDCEPDCNGNAVPDECETDGRHGLAGAFYDGPDFTGTLRGRVDPQVAFNWGQGAPWPDFGVDTFSVRWSGFVRTLSWGGNYTFYTYSNDGVRLWVNGELLIDQWVTQPGTEWSATVALQARTDYPIVLEYFDDTGNAVVVLRWRAPGGAKIAIPSDLLRPALDLDFDGLPDDCVACACRVGDLVWLDVNGNGLQDGGEPGLEGVTVRLYSGCGDGKVLVEDAVTDANGFYEFTGAEMGLCAGDYQVEVDQTTVPSGLTETVPNRGADDERDSDFVNGVVCVSLPADDAEDLSSDCGFALRPVGGEGCGPGYWEQSHHFDSWPAGYTPHMLFSDVFDDAFPGMTLVEVLAQGGGGLNALGRQTVAALLNAASVDVDYDLLAGEVVSMFNAAWPEEDAHEPLTDVFKGFNEQGCPLN